MNALCFTVLRMCLDCLLCSLSPLTLLMRKLQAPFAYDPTDVQVRPFAVDTGVKSC